MCIRFWFTPRRGPAEDLNAYLTDKLSSAPYRYRATILFHCPWEALVEHTSPTAGRLERYDDHSCLFHTGAATLDEIALHIALKGVDFRVVDPPELNDRLRALAARLTRAADQAP
ncbi:WYL domain-containing protein [Streptomyces tricolor]|uniref:WYL domain-containing protein n=1 Tax=Streptomyces tricolor TaxID=68277 RepID=A0ABS9JU73_9ACTN|nr:WYL domain-containing protein [Streptomyces tricolor]MCG0069095.1 WYL domain-containing protein [Streptomyces tricolor]